MTNDGQYMIVYHIIVIKISDMNFLDCDIVISVFHVTVHCIISVLHVIMLPLNNQFGS